MIEKCSICKSNRETCVYYLNHSLCDICWDKYAEKDVNALRIKLGLTPQKTIIMDDDKQDIINVTLNYIDEGSQDNGT